MKTLDEKRDHFMRIGGMIPSVAYSLGAQDARERRPALYIQVLAFDARTASYERRNAGKFEPAGATRIARDYVDGYRSAKP